jgi:Lysyl oxidase
MGSPVYRSAKMRWLGVLACVVGAAAGGVFAVGLAGGTPASRLPDLDQTAPYAVSVQRREGRYVLVFGSAVENVGRGALEIEGRRSGSARAMDTTQIIRRTDRSILRRPLGRILWYEHAETHSHWHLHRFERYELRRAGDGQRVLRAIKQGFCLGDRYDRNRNELIPGEPFTERWTHACMRGNTGLRRINEGISPGYGDDYAPYLEGQFFSLRGLRAGRYVIVHRVNPFGVLRESSYANNAASVLVELRRPAGRAPRVVVLRRCGGSASCTPVGTSASRAV